MKILKIREVAKELNVCTETLRRWDNSGLLKAYRTPKGRRFYTAEQIQEFLQRCKNNELF